MKIFDESYRVDLQRWTKWPKALIMTHEWSTDGRDRRLEQRRYVPDNYAVQLEMENSRIKANAEYDKKLADVELEEAHAIRHNIDSLRERVHEVAADRDRIKAENEKLRKLVRDMWHDGMCDCDEFIHSLGVCARCEYGYHERMRDLRIEVER